MSQGEIIAALRAAGLDVPVGTDPIDERIPYGYQKCLYALLKRIEALEARSE